MAGLRLPLLLMACFATAIFAWRDHESRAPGVTPQKTEPRARKSKNLAATAPQQPPGVVDLTENPLAAIEVSGLTAWVQRPLFAPSRRPPPPPPPKAAVVRPVAAVPAPAPKPPPPRYALIGVVSDGSRAIGLLRQEGKTASIMVEIGDSIGGWRVADIRPRSVLLEREDGTTDNVTIAPD